MGKVVESKNSRFTLGQFVEGHLQWAEYNISDGSEIRRIGNIVEGFENTVDAFLGLFRGDNFGKQLVQVADQ